MSEYEISSHDTEQQARDAHAKKNPGSKSWHIGIPATPHGYVRPQDRAPQPEGTLSRARQSLRGPKSQTTASSSHPEHSQSGAGASDEAEGHYWGSNPVSLGGEPDGQSLESESVWNSQSAIKKPARTLTLGSEFEDGWKE